MKAEPKEPPQEKPRRVLTQGEILAGLSDLAENGEGAQRSQAYRMLMAAGGTVGITLPAPLTRAETIPLLARLMKGAGPEMCQLAFRRAFPRKDMLDVPKVEIENYSAPEGIQLAKTLQALYKACPETRRPGFPKGYPYRMGVEATVRWCQLEHLKALKGRELMAIEAMRAADLPEPVHAPEIPYKLTYNEEEDGTDASPA